MAEHLTDQYLTTGQVYWEVDYSSVFNQEQIIAKRDEIRDSIIEMQKRIGTSGSGNGSAGGEATNE